MRPGVLRESTEADMSQRVPIARRRFNVHPIQQKYFFLSLVPLLFFGATLIVLVLSPLNFAPMGSDPELNQPAPLREILPLMDARIWFALLISMLVSCALSYVVTHKFAGQLYRIEQILRKGKEGNLPPSVRVRRDDDLQELAELLDGNFKKTTSALAEIMEQQALAAKELAAVRGSVNAGLPGEMILTGLDSVGQRLQEVKGILTHFKVPQGQASRPKSHEVQ
jgi:methyl-accepting chemotaxis protein